jgi:hypothetical protein
MPQMPINIGFIVRHNNIDASFLNPYVNKVFNYPIPKWVLFCQEMLFFGCFLDVGISNTTKSKYIYVKKNKSNKHIVKVRFSEHPTKRQDSDILVGPGGMSYQDALEKTYKTIEDKL